MRAIYKREMQAYFYTTIGYLFVFVFLALSSVLFYLQILRQRSGDILTFIGQMSYLSMLLTPLLTMRLMAEERQKRTDQLLLTSPVSVTGIVFGKYAAAVSVMLITIVLTGIYMIIVAAFGKLYHGEMLVGYLGFTLESCSLIALDLCCGTAARTPVAAAVLAFGANFVVWILDLVATAVTVSPVENVLEFLSLYRRNEPFLMGQLSFAGIVFDCAFAASFLMIAVYLLDSRRYKEA